MRHMTTQKETPQNLPLSVLLPPVLPSPSVAPSIANYPAGLLHDARNMLAAMDIYCDLLRGPGVLAPEYRHLADELHLLRESSSGLIDRLLVNAVTNATRGGSFEGGASPDDPSRLSEGIGPRSSQDFLPLTSRPDHPGRKRVTDIGADLRFSHAMLSALAGPKVKVDLVTDECPEGELLIASADFTRVLINLVRNAAEAMGTGGRIAICARMAPLTPGAGVSVLLSVEDNGPGIPLTLLEKIFDLNAANAALSDVSKQRMSFRPRGLGLRIVRELVEAGGGTINATRLPERGSRFEIVLPMVTNVRTQP